MARMIESASGRLSKHIAIAVVLVAGVGIAGPHDSALAAADAAQRHIAVQDTWFTDANVRGYGVLNDVVSISGHWFLQEGTFGGDHQDFLSKTVQDVVRRLDVFKEKHPEVDPGTGVIVLIDIEKPHLRSLHEWEEDEQDEIVRAYRTRITATRIAFPNAKLALWGTLNPDPQGRPDAPQYVERLRALKEAGDEGLYDDIDYLVPVLYVPFGCDNELLGPCDRHWDTLDEYTQLGIDGSRQLLRSDDSPLPLLPFLGFKVYNCAECSQFAGSVLITLGVPDPVQATLGRQIDIIVANGVRDYVFWTGEDENELGGPGDPTVTDHFCELFRQRCTVTSKAAGS